MFIELVDILRCVRPHEDCWLVLRADLMSGRHVVTGALGCPLCGAEYVIENGEARFLSIADGKPRPVIAAAVADVSWLDDDEAPLRLTALLALADVRQPVLLMGRWATLGGPLADLAPALYLVANPEQRLGPERAELSVIHASGALPLADGKLHGAALDAAAVRAGLLDGAARAVRAGGRLVAPASAPLPAHYTELGSDNELWVAERQRMPTGTPVPLARASRTG